MEENWRQNEFLWSLYFPYRFVVKIQKSPANQVFRVELENGNIDSIQKDKIK